MLLSNLFQYLILWVSQGDCFLRWKIISEGDYYYFEGVKFILEAGLSPAEFEEYVEDILQNEEFILFFPRISFNVSPFEVFNCTVISFKETS